MERKKTIAIIGLGKMGFRISENLLDKEWKLIAYDLDKEIRDRISEKGAFTVDSLIEVISHLQSPRIIILSVPAGKVIDEIIETLLPSLSKGDIIIDSGNTFFRDSQKRADDLKNKGLHFMDVGMSGGVSGARHGACLMIGGEFEVFKKNEELFENLSKNGSYKYLGKSGSGHLVKGYHNLVEYGFLQALAEGLECIDGISEKNELNINLADVCKIWDKGSIVESRIISDAVQAFNINPGLEKISGSIYGQTQIEMENLVKTGIELNIKVPSCDAALQARLSSQLNPTFTGKIINAIRNVFGGHQEWKKQ